MCEALRELMKPELDAAVAEAVAKVTAEVTATVSAEKDAIIADLRR